MRVVEEKEIVDVYAGDFFGFIVGSGVGGTIGFFTLGPGGLIAGAAAGGYWGDNIEDAVNG